MKTIKTLLLTITALLCSLTATAHDFEVGGIYYNITSEEEKTVEVTYRGNDYDSYSNEYIDSVVIHNSVTYNGNTYSVTKIGYCAFYKCSSLNNIEIPNSVISIGDHAFYDTAWYNNQPDGVVYAGKVVYKYKGTMPSNTSIIIKDGTLGFGICAFQNCKGLTSIEIPNSVTGIGNYAFYGCSGLTSVTITSIGNLALSGCDGLKKLFGLLIHLHRVIKCRYNLQLCC